LWSIRIGHCFHLKRLLLLGLFSIASGFLLPAIAGKIIKLCTLALLLRLENTGGAHPQVG
jgi:hypothetical protein